MGYFSAPQEWAELQGDPEAWKEWWQNPDAESYYFIGKDNIPFHAVYWPALLMGYGGLNLPTDVPANQFLTFGGEKGSASRGVGRSHHVVHRPLRAGCAALRRCHHTSPRRNDTDLSDAEIERRINDELVATWGNLVNRVVSMTHRYFDGVVPAAGRRRNRRPSVAGTRRPRACRGRRDDRRGQAACRSRQRHVDGPGGQRLPQRDASRGRRPRPTWTAPGRRCTLPLNAIAGIAVAARHPICRSRHDRCSKAWAIEVPPAGPRWVPPARDRPARQLGEPAQPLLRQGGAVATRRSRVRMSGGPGSTPTATCSWRRRTRHAARSRRRGRRRVGDVPRHQSSDRVAWPPGRCAAPPRPGARWSAGLHPHDAVGVAGSRSARIAALAADAHAIGECRTRLLPQSVAA